jgi:hypothetical protein
VSTEGVLVIDLVIELTDYLESLPREPYRELVHGMLIELLDFYHRDLDDDVVTLAQQTINMFDPAASPTPEEIAYLGAVWQDVLDRDFRMSYNARTFCWALSLVDNDLTTGRRAVAGYVGDALVAWQIRPLAPTETGPDWIDTAIADPATIEIQILQRFIASAQQAVARTGVRVHPWGCRMTIDWIASSLPGVPDELSRWPIVTTPAGSAAIAGHVS